MKIHRLGAKILISCIICSTIVLLLFLVAYRLAQTSCQLQSADETQLRGQQFELFVKQKPTRSHDKSMLMKVAAYIEYNIQQKNRNKNKDNKRDKVGASNSPAELLFGQSAQVAPPGGGQWNQSHLLPLANSSQAAAQLQSAPATPIGTNRHLTPPPQAHNQTGSQNQTNQRPSTNSELRVERRFLPLELDEIETRELEESNKFTYILSFNCSTLRLNVVRGLDRVQVESMELELTPSIKRKSSCEIQLGGQSQIVAHSARSPTNSSLPPGSWPFAYYACNKPIRLQCFAPAPHNQSPLVELHLMGLEFQTLTSEHSAGSHVAKEFKLPAQFAGSVNYYKC